MLPEAPGPLCMGHPAMCAALARAAEQAGAVYLRGVEDIEVKPTLGMQDPWRYRNKVQQPVGWDGQRIISGFYAPFSHDIVPIEECLVQSELSVRLLNRYVKEGGAFEQLFTALRANTFRSEAESLTERPEELGPEMDAIYPSEE